MILTEKNYKDNELVLQNANKLKGKNIFINEYCRKETTELRKELWKKAKR